jgi:hypothetical protein
LPSLPFAAFPPVGKGINCQAKLSVCAVWVFHGTEPDFHVNGWMDGWMDRWMDGWLRRCAMPLELTPMRIETLQIVPDEKVEEGNRLNNSEPNQKI